MRAGARTLFAGAAILALALFAGAPRGAGQEPPEGQERPRPPGDPTAGPEGQEGQDITLILAPGQRGFLRLAFPEIRGRDRLSGAAARAAQELDETLRRDLEAARIFQVQGPEELEVLQLTGEAARDFELYRSLGNEILLQAEIKPQGERLVLEGRVFDLASGQSILGKRYRGEYELARRIAHTFADEIVLFFTGRRGVALTTIAYSSDRTGHKEIFLMDADGENQRPITAHKSISMSPDWGPTGESIAYVSFYGGSPGIYLAEVATGQKRPVVTQGGFNTSPSFSNDGQRIAFSRSVEGNVEIFVANRDGSGLKRLTHSPGIDTNPAWSPTGREIAFTSSRAGNPHIYVMDSEGANNRRVTFIGDYNDGAAWAPDGTKIAHATRRGAAFDIALTDLVTLESRILAGGPGSEETPVFSPDGRRIAFASSRSSGSRRETQIYVMDADGSNVEQLTQSGNNYTPAWSGYGR